MKIVYGCTITNNETLDIFYKNIKHLKSLNINVILIANTNHKIINNDIRQIKKVGDMKKSRDALNKAATMFDADAYFIFDSDIDITNLTSQEFTKIFEYAQTYDFISLYYKSDPPIPAFYTLASSLNDYYNLSKNHIGKSIPFFDDSDFNMSSYQISNSQNHKKNLKVILKGKSYARDIVEFTNKIDEVDTTTGGATIYFNKKLLMKEYKWPKYNNKSLTWYDSYRTFCLSKKWKFAKVPIFVNHYRHDKSIQLDWKSVIRYILGFNVYMNKRSDNWNDDALILHTIELFYYIQGMLIKIGHLDINESDKKTIKHIKEFMNIDIFKLIKGVEKWK